jgi:hypothetical protein
VSLDQTLLNIDESFSLVCIVATALFIELILQGAFYLLPLELLFRLDQIFGFCKQDGIDARRGRLGRVWSLCRGYRRRGRPR